MFQIDVATLRLADEMGDPAESFHAVGIGMAGRSGSTLISQMFRK